MNRYEIGKPYAGLKILSVVREGNTHHKTYRVRHVIDCGHEYDIIQDAITKRLKRGEFDHCKKCRSLKKYNTTAKKDHHINMVFLDQHMPVTTFKINSCWRDRMGN